MKHTPTPMTFVGTASRQARNGKHYRVLVYRCPVCDRAKQPVANASRGKKVAPCNG